MAKMDTKHPGTSKGSARMVLLTTGTDLSFICATCGPGKKQDAESQPSGNMQTHIDIQDLIRGAFSQKGFSSGARNLIRTLVGEHGPSTLVPSRPVNRPVPVDDGAAGTTSQSWQEQRDRSSCKPRACSREWTGPLPPSGWLIHSSECFPKIH